MGKVYPEIEPRLRAFIEAQPVFFVATAPTSVDGHVNVSPKGMRGTLVVLGPHRVAYLDYHGSGAETIAHLRDNGRVTLMFCAFSGPPKILRLYGRGHTVPVDDPGFAARLADFPDPPDRHTVRAVIAVEVDRVADSCGFAVPVMEYQHDRDMLITHHGRKTTEELVAYRASRNAASIDGLPVF
ncbi:pyridoxamine 5'-phosphate oxidase family protein [Micromonospora sp. WMMD882]|uniref:pyridoxamine 5'-phosphate oxidase family protein n=1 Tax=Micromonospora sp. WMMD882 TaxID=3015151 RepID=UPI00248AE9B9|nr:pyridoxamine 5'-phosphate oxidase family protein [Micromonospora sp. WMMD882]WBB81878.1 pyridoxamine 5'-phosphate oxidase family protein [Micromonospora sp. WMMD882]